MRLIGIRGLFNYTN